MAASLVKAMSWLHLGKKVVLPLKGLQNRSVFNLWYNNSENASLSTCKKPDAVPGPQYPFTSRILQTYHQMNAPVRLVTYEIKQWREHRVINRFYRLHWGAWIRCKGGRNRKLYMRSPKTRWILKQHIFCNKTQNKRLDRLVTPHWREPKYFVDSPYEPYHQRTNFSQFPRRRKFYP